MGNIFLKAETFFFIEKRLRCWWPDLMKFIDNETKMPKESISNPDSTDCRRFFSKLKNVKIAIKRSEGWPHWKFIWRYFTGEITLKLRMREKLLGNWKIKGRWRLPTLTRWQQWRRRLQQWMRSQGRIGWRFCYWPVNYPSPRWTWWGSLLTQWLYWQRSWERSALSSHLATPGQIAKQAEPEAGMDCAVGENFINSDQTGADNDQHLFNSTRLTSQGRRCWWSTSELGKSPGRFWRNIIEQTEAGNIDIRPDSHWVLLHLLSK